MEKVIVVDPDTIFGLQTDLIGKIRAAHKRQDYVFFDALRAFLKINQSQQRRLVEQVLDIKYDNGLFGKALLEEIVTIPDPGQFTLGNNILPGQEYKYEYISYEIRAQHFAKQKFSGIAKLKIVPLIRGGMFEELVWAADQKDALATLAVLHNKLKKHPHCFDEFKGGPVVIPVPSIKKNAAKMFFYIYLTWECYGKSYSLQTNIGFSFQSNYYVALLSPANF